MEKKKGTLIKAYTSVRKMTDSINYDSVILYYRDEHGVKKTQFIDRAEIPFYVIKDKTLPEALTPPMFIEADKVEKISSFSDLFFKEVAMKTDSLYYYDRVLTTWGQNSSNMKNLLKHNYIYDADMDIADRYIAKFHEEYEPDISYKLHKCYYDIEVDLMENGFKKRADGTFGYMGFPDQEVAPAPINIITLFDQKIKKFYTFILRNKLNTSLIDFENRSTDFIKYIQEKIAKEDNVAINEIDLIFFNAEEDMIEGFFKKVHEIDPDFMLAWNASFDVKTMLNRLKKLYGRKKELQEQGVKAYDQMLTVASDPKYMIQYDRFNNPVYMPPKAYYYSQDKASFVNRIDMFTVMDGINWMD